MLLDRVGCLSGVEVECWGEVLTDDRDPRALGADSLTSNSGELWALGLRLSFGCVTSRAMTSLLLFHRFTILRWQEVL